MYMEHIYIHTNNTVSYMQYHFVFCPRDRRKIFIIPGVEQRFKELVSLKCKELNVQVVAIYCNVDHAHLVLSCLPTHKPADVILTLKKYIGNALRIEIPQLSKMPNVWTRNYLISTEEELDPQIIQRYVESQRNSGVVNSKEVRNEKTD